MQCLGADWVPADALPADEIRHLPALIRFAENSLQAADPADFAVAMDGLIEWADLCGLVTLPVDPIDRRKQVARIVKMYLADIGHLPPDVLEDALRAVRRRHKWQKLPTPADILGEASAELERRRWILRRATTARDTAKAREPEGTRRRKPTPEEIAQVEAATRAIKRAPVAPIGGNLGPEIKRVIDTRPYTPDQLAEAREALRLLADRKRPIDGYVPPHDRGAA